MEKLDYLTSERDILEVIKTILEQDKIILLTNRMLLEYLSCPSVKVVDKCPLEEERR